MAEHAPLGGAAGARGVDDAGELIAAARVHLEALGGAGLPVDGGRDRHVVGGLGDHHEGALEELGAPLLAEAGPGRGLGDQHPRLAVGDEVELLAGGELVDEGDQGRAGPEGAGRRDQPLRLVLHQDRAAIAGLEAALLDVGGDALRQAAELGEGVAGLLAVAVDLDEGDARLEGGGRVGERLADALHAGEVEHQRLLSILAASAAKVLTPWSS